MGSNPDTWPPYGIKPEGVINSFKLLALCNMKSLTVDAKHDSTCIGYSGKIHYLDVLHPHSCNRAVCEHSHTNCTANFRNGNIEIEMGRKWWIAVYDLLHGVLSVDLCSKSPTELVHDEFMRHVLLIAQCSSHVLSFSAPSLPGFQRQFSISHAKWVLRIIRTSLQQLPLLTCCAPEGKRCRKSEVWEMLVQAGWPRGLSLC